jgi:hypothetical protein
MTMKRDMLCADLPGDWGILPYLGFPFPACYIEDIGHGACLGTEDVQTDFRV